MSSLIENTGGYGGFYASLSSMERLLYPTSTVSSFLEESSRMPPALFILHKIYKCRKTLGMPHQHLEDDVEILRQYMIEIFVAYCHKHRAIGQVGHLVESEDTLPAILANLVDTSSDLGPIDFWKVTTIQYESILGFLVGGNRWFIPPSMAHTVRQKLQLGTGYVRERYQPNTSAQPELWLTPGPGLVKPQALPMRPLSTRLPGQVNLVQNTQASPMQSQPQQLLKPSIQAPPMQRQSYAGVSDWMKNNSPNQSPDRQFSPEMIYPPTSSSSDS
ncbi:hypothetical protein Forpe1208_v010762 [Fusarium oxysporum f. sp. rapae]|uniref:Uncharacterized protein n=1 Tax=Fusarium oxysporum f. sp. rapae TaxID=485398 RepID=A0A8J5P0Y3_FUSOX|nr:hypothetical protein Forpe1208_v010762 [Fusarium oxysporum f. sp. rapae]